MTQYQSTACILKSRTKTGNRLKPLKQWCCCVAKTKVKTQAGAAATPRKAPVESGGRAAPSLPRTPAEGSVAARGFPSTR